MKRVTKAAIGGVAFVAASAVVITSDPGGSIANYARYHADLRARGVPVVIDGYCGSSCTMALANPKVCVTRKAILGFHSAYWPWFIWFGPRMFDIPSSTKILWDHYPYDVQKWLSDRGGLTPDMKYLQGATLRQLVKEC